MSFFYLSEMKLKQKRKGVFAKVITGKSMQMTLIHLDYGVSTSHSHDNEQMGYILCGIVVQKKRRIVWMLFPK